ncbi:MAG TPA: presenilin family intramembrane aspartyl protease [Candidatus Bilamarchaeum sp.]|nr:presenilin family intramembrane aspartyl protease [Candidatus Bilamarchaeum sp.]
MRLILSLLGIFIIAQLLGIYTGTVILKDFTRNPYVSSLAVTTDSDDPFNAVFFIVYILAGAALMIVLIRYFGMVPIVFRLMEFFLISSSSSIVFYSFARTAIGYETSTVIGVIAGLLFSGAKLVFPGLKNAAAVFATAGVGVIFGISLGLFPLILFLIFLSVYDFLSVFQTKHMVEMADFIVKKDMAFTVTAKAPPPAPGEKEQRIDLGTGDIIAPIMLEVATLTLSPAATALVFAGAVLSLGIFLSAVWRKKMVLPALPPIVLGMIVALSVGFLLGLY